MEEKYFVVYDRVFGYFTMDKLYRVQMDFIDYVKDEAGTPIGIRAKYDAGCNSGVDLGWHEVTLYPHQKFEFDYHFMDITGPSDWSNDSIRMCVTLLPYDEISQELREKWKL